MHETIKNALSQLWGNKLRTFLTMLGMLIGISAVIIILALGQGMNDEMNSQFAGIGKSTLQVNVIDGVNEHKLGQEDVETLKAIPEVKDVVLMHDAYMGMTKDAKKADKMVMIYGIPYNYEQIQSLNLRYGRMFGQRDEQVKSNIIIVEDNYARIMCKKRDPEYILGKSVEMTIGGEVHSFEVVGVAKSQYPSSCPDEMVVPIIYMPFATMDQYTMDGRGRSSMAGIIIEDGYDANEYTKPIQKLLEKQHAAEDAYRVTSIISQVDAITDVLNTVNLFVSVVAGISLLVGGIGIMNIMMVTVKERTREIGVRKAIGATDQQIMLQFLVEALILTLIGGLSGLVIGYVGGILIAQIIQINAKLTLGMVVFAVGISSAIGIIFGVYPAYRASKLDPVEALREE